VEVGVEPPNPTPVSGTPVLDAAASIAEPHTSLPDDTRAAPAWSQDDGDSESEAAPRRRRTRQERREDRALWDAEALAHQAQQRIRALDRPSVADRRRALDDEGREALRAMGVQETEEDSGIVLGEGPATARRVRQSEATDGSRRRVSTEASLDGTTVSAGRTWRTQGPEPDDDAAPIRETSASASFDFDDLQLGGQLQRQSGPEGREVTTTGTANATFGDTGIEGVTVGASRRYPGGRSIRGSAGYTTDIEQPQRRPDNRWQVHGTMTWNVRGSGGLRRGRASGTVGGHAGEEREFTRIFATEREARRFYDQATRTFNLAAPWTEFSNIDSSASAAAMADGEQRSQTIEQGVDAGLNTDLPMGVSLGMSVGLSNAVAMTVTRADANAADGSAHRYVDVELRNTDTLSGSGSLSVPLAGVRFGGSTGWISGTTIRFDITAGAGSPGWEALDRCINSRSLPEADRGDGFRVIASTTGTQSRSTSGAELGPLSIGSSSTLTEETRTDEDGNQHQRVTGSHGVNARLGPEWLGLSGTSSTQMRSESGQGATLRISVDGSDARDSANCLARATGEAAHMIGVHGDDAGAWTLTSRLSEAQVRQMLQAIYDNSFQRAPLGTAAGEAAALRAEVRAAESLDQARRALVNFVSEVGDRAMAMVRETLGVRLRYDVTLTGSAVYQGGTGRGRMWSEIDTIREALEENSDPQGTAARTRSLVQEQSERVASMRDGEDARELPPSIRADQLERNERILEELRELNTAARTAARATIRGADDAEEASSDRETAETGHTSDPESHRLWTSMQGDLSRMRERRSEAMGWRRITLAEQELHRTRGDEGTGRAISFALGSYEGQSDRYVRARRAIDAAARRLDAAHRLKQSVEDLLDNLPATEIRLTSDQRGKAQEIRRLSWQLHDIYLDARESYVAAHDSYAAIRRHIADEGRTRRYFGSTRLPSRP